MCGVRNTGSGQKTVILRNIPVSQFSPKLLLIQKLDSLEGGGPRGTCGGMLQCLLVFPLESQQALQSSSICLPLYGREHPRDLVTVACRVDSLNDN